MHSPFPSTVIVFVRTRPGILNQAAVLLHGRGLRLSAIALSRADTRGLARLTMQLHEDDVAAAIHQLERHLVSPRISAPDLAGTPTPYRWQADGVSDDDAA